MNSNLISHYVLTVLPIWTTAFLLYVLTMGVLFILRDRREGLFYNTSYASVLGDGALIAVVLIAAGILQRETHLPGWLQSSRWADVYDMFSASTSITLGIIWLNFDRSKQWGDWYHHIVIAPLLCYLLLTLLPVIWMAGTHLEKWAMLCLIVSWIVCVIYDIKTDRLDQRNYFNLGEHLDTIWFNRWHWR